MNRAQGSGGVWEAAQIGRTFDLFDWTGVNPTGTFNVVSEYEWDISRLYTTGEVTLVPEPGAGVLLVVAVVGLVVCGGEEEDEERGELNVHVQRPTSNVQD